MSYDEMLYFEKSGGNSSSKYTLYVFIGIIVSIFVLVLLFGQSIDNFSSDFLDVVYDIIKKVSLFVGILFLLAGFMFVMSEEGKVKGIIFLILGVILILLWLDPINFVNQIMNDINGTGDTNISGDNFPAYRSIFITLGAILVFLGVIFMGKKSGIGKYLLVLGIIILVIFVFNPFKILNFIESFFDDSIGFPKGYY
ncbi:MAG: hypothetical protein JXA99_11380 [Candidatus Lokiarchaeota archaeon]|nr:hypothetical protein [Candidatus Lokiarchaeota archaeon]